MSNSSEEAPSFFYRRDIDGLRAVAILSVVSFHAFPNWVQGGYIGVDIFFVISGFLITSIILKGLRKGEFSFLEFYSRRVRRIFPAMITVLVVSYVLGWFVLLANEYQQLGKHIAGGTSFVSNFVLWSESGYFDDEAETKPLLHLWSLGIEEQFYLIWPLLIYVGWRFRCNVFVIVLSVWAISFVINISITYPYPIAAFYSPFSRFWELLIGSMLAVLSSKQSTDVVRSGNWESCLGLFMIAIAIFVLDQNSAFPGWWALLPTFGAALIIAGGSDSWVNRLFLANPIMVGIGIVSYPLYLWHWPLLSLAHIVEGGIPDRAIRLQAILLSGALAWLTYQYLEKNVRFRPQKYVVGLLLIIGFGIFVLGIGSWQEVIKPRQHDKGLEKIVTAVGDWDFPPKSFELFKFENQYFYRTRGTQQAVLFWGDSYMEQYGPRIEELLSNNAREIKPVIFATTGGCPPIPHVYENKHPDCQLRFNAAKKLAFRPDVETVVFGANWWLYFVKHLNAKQNTLGGYYFQNDGPKEFFKGGQGVELAFESFSEFLGSLASANKKIFLILNSPSDTSLDPKNYYEGSRFSQLRFKPKGNLLRHEFEKGYGPLKEKLISVGLGVNATIIDPLEYLCAGDICPGTLADGTPIYKDDGHIRAFYSKNYCDFIDPIVQLPSLPQES